MLSLIKLFQYVSGAPLSYLVTCQIVNACTGSNERSRSPYGVKDDGGDKTVKDWGDANILDLLTELLEQKKRLEAELRELNDHFNAELREWEKRWERMETEMQKLRDENEQLRSELQQEREVTAA